MSDTALVIGEALVDVVRRTDGSVEVHPGGSPANVAIGLGRLGRDVELLTWLGDDAHGDQVRAHLAGSGVTLSPGSSSAPRTSVATATLDATGAATYDFDLTWEIAAGAAPVTAPLVAHTGSIAAVLEPGGADVVSLLAGARSTSTITYDPNARPALMGDPATALAAIETVIDVADVVKVSDEDIEWLTGGAGVDGIARSWAARGPAFVVVTRGGDGATAFMADGRELSIAAPSVSVADTVGAGDSFMGGLIDGLWGAGLLGAGHRDALHGIGTDVLEGILDRCARIAAITVSRPGANPPSSAELGEA
ncbi:carbohydrate kinase family protein [Demequina activiva]|uniref:Fructokinase n=1 Tax=Demequina activiva TaxID=1582364 RepID=A0A919UFF2_9MICO|nr:carbohydrate kinase [Demequina activiva]GIG53607.1 fructokinase [Demequina activiva]